MSTPKAPTPLRSSAAGGLEKDVVPDGRDELDALLAEDDGRLEEELGLLLVDDGLLDDVVEALFVSWVLPAGDLAVAELEPADEDPEADEPEVLPGREEP